DEIYDPFDRTVSSVLILPAPHSAAVALANNKTLVIGASGASLLDLANQTAEALAADELARNGATATDLQGDRKILVAGGQNLAGALVDLGAVFNPAKVSTDYDDYPPGTPVGITGNGFLPGETVQLQVLHIGNDGGDNETSGVHAPWSVTDGGEGDLDGKLDGNVETVWNIPFDEDELGATLEVTAKGVTSGLETKATFTDAQSANL